MKDEIPLKNQKINKRKCYAYKSVKQKDPRSRKLLVLHPKKEIQKSWEHDHQPN